MSPDRSRGGRLTGPPGVGGPPPTGQPATASYEPSPHGGRMRHLSPPPVTPHGMSQAALAQQAFAHLGQDQAQTARPQWQPQGRVACISPLPQRHSAQSLHAPSTQPRPVVQLSGSPPTAAGRAGPMIPLPVRLDDPSQAGGHMVPMPGRTPSMDGPEATARFSYPATTAPPWALQHPNKSSRSEQEQQHSAREHRRAGSMGGCSVVSSVPGHSPKTTLREPKSSIEVPVAVTAAKPVVIDTETYENVKSVGKVTDSMSLKMDEVAGKVDSIEKMVKMHSSAEKVEALQQELEQANQARRIAEEAAVAQARAHAEVEERLRQSQQMLHEEASRHEQQIAVSEDARREAEMEVAVSRQHQSQAEAARAAVSESTNLASHWEGECQKKDARIVDLERKMKTVNDQCNTYKVRHTALENQVDQKRLENDKIREQFERLSLENSQMRERLEMENAALIQEKQELEASLADVNGRFQAANIEHRALQEEALQQVRDISRRDADSRAAASAAAAAQRERRETAQITAQLEARERAVAAKEHELVAMRHRAADLEHAHTEMDQQRGEMALKRAELEQQRQEMEQQFERQRQELDSQVKTQQKTAKHADHEKENRSLKQTMQDQKTELFNLESQLHREQCASSYITPGEFLRMAKKHEGELFAHENSALKLRAANLEAEVREVRWHNELVRKHLPRSEWEAVAKELQAQTLPPPVDAEVAMH